MPAAAAAVNFGTFHEEAAIDALEQIRDELRTATEVPVEQAIPAAIEASS